MQNALSDAEYRSIMRQCGQIRLRTADVERAALLRGMMEINRLAERLFRDAPEDLRMWPAQALYAAQDCIKHLDDRPVKRALGIVTEERHGRV